jgi:lipoate-protein ligase A
MKYIRLKTNNPYYNLAVEEYLFRSTDDDIFMLWQNAPTVVVGKNQNVYAEVDVEHAKHHGALITRRITGGGAVYHDLGNVNYTFITSDKKAKSLDYEYFTRPIISALAMLGLKCEMSGRNDLLCEGRKFSGNAQHTANGRILHHGTLLFDTDLEDMSHVLRIDKEKLEYNAVKSHKSRVVNLKELLGADVSVGDFIDAIERFVVSELGAEKVEMTGNPEIASIFARNQSDEWIYSDKRYLTNYKVFRRKKYPFGIVKLEMKLDRDIIDDIVISGDFFERESVEDLENLIKGRRLGDLDGIEVSKYIDKMTTSELSDLMTNE